MRDAEGCRSLKGGNMRAVAVLVALFALVSAGIVPAAGSEEVPGEGKRIHREEKYEKKLYGVVEKMPDGVVGTWVVGGKEVAVNEKTVIDEEHGLLEVGAYLEIKGSFIDGVFTARKVEVKKGK